MDRKKVTFDLVRDLFEYDEENGTLVRRVRRGKRGVVGDVLGRLRPDGYTATQISGKQYFLHRLIWLYVFGEWPIGFVDHINGDRSDNRIGNLRDVSKELNAQNQRRAQSHSTHGYLGASFQCGRWIALIRCGKKRHCLGYFDTPEEAHAAYVQAKRTIHPGCTI